MGEPQADQRDAGPVVDRRYFFVHPMKTGGGSFNLYLRRTFGRKRVYPAPVDRENDPPGLIRATNIYQLLHIPEPRRRELVAYAGHFPLVAARLLDEDLCVITMLRDPVQRTVSHLRHRGELDPKAADLTLEQIYDRPWFFNNLLRNHQTRFFAMVPSDEPRTFFHPVPLDEQRLEIAKQQLATVDVLGLNEAFDELCDHMQTRFGWPERQSRDVHVSEVDEEPTSALLERIVEDNALDVELYRHATELYQQRKQAGTGP